MLGGITFLLMIVSLYLVFVYAPTEELMGNVQRIFYFHVPLAWVAFLAFFVVFLGSIFYLLKKEQREEQFKWDILASSSAEIGVVFSTLVLITGSIWGKVAWNTWWTWDPRLTTTLVLWLLYVAYLILRSYIPEYSNRARFAAVYGIIAFIDVPIVWVSIRWWRTIHPVVFSAKKMTIEPEMFYVLIVCLLTFTLIYFYLLKERINIEKMRNELMKLKEGK
jgi:heme exporter protein C